MNQNIIDKMKREILVVKNSHLFANTKREDAFYLSDKCDFENIILEKFEYMER
jgi:hypothetical protein